jgi:hypothetical protein
MCHLPPGNPENIQTISVGFTSIQAHLDHGDGIGDCENNFAVITVVKNVVNDNNGNKSPSDFTIILKDSNNDETTFSGSSSGTTILLPIGFYSITEIPDSEYSPFFSPTCTGTAEPLDVISCTVTNNDIVDNPGTIIIEKETNPNGSLLSFNFTANFIGGFSLSDGESWSLQRN